MSIITRKVFLNLSLAAFASLVLASLTACFNRINPANIFSSTAADSTTVPKETGTSSEVLAEDEAASTTIKEAAINKAAIGIAGGESSVSILVAKAVELAGGLGFIKEGSTVLIKPNINTGDPYPASTNPEVVYEVINLVKKQNPGRILVGDRSGFWLNTIDCMKKSKIYDAAISAGAEIYPFDKEKWIKVKPKEAKNWPGGFSIPKIINDADYIISIPVLKTHSIANFSIAIKNWVGILYPANRTKGLHLFSKDKEVFGSKLAELHLSRLPSFIVTDCTRVFTEGGPTNGKAVDVNMVYASNDIIANDVLGLAILKTLGTIDIIQDNSAWVHPQIKRAVELGLGISDCTKVEIKPYNVSNIDLILKNIY